MDRLLILFRRSRSLPQLPGAAIRLARIIDSDAASFAEVERIISTDPGLAIRILRASNSVKFAGAEPILTIRSAVMRLGLRSVKTLALSFVVQDVVKSSGAQVNLGRFVYHSVFVGLLARYIFARRQREKPFASDWTGDELFAAGIMHDVHVPLLARVAPEVLSRAVPYAQRVQLTIEDAFDKLYSHPMASLGAAAATTWQLPELFPNAIVNMRRPWAAAESTAMSCLAYAEYLAANHGATTEEWPVSASMAPDVLLEVELPPEEVADLLTILGEHTHAFLEGTELAIA